MSKKPQHQQHYQLPKLIPAIMFAELITKVTVNADTPSGTLTSLDEFGLHATVYKTKRLWHPNWNAKAYQARRDDRKRGW